MSPATPSAGPRRLLLLRHGRTAWNLEQRIQGQTDVPLDDAGLLQAEKVAPVLAAMEPAFVRSSDLSRARVTAEKVAQACGLVVETDPRLREFDLGERAGTLLTEYAATAADEFAAFRAGRYDVVPGGESREQVATRFGAALDDALAAVPAGGLGVVVAHGAALKVSTAAWLGWPAEVVLGLHALGNCHWALLDDPGSTDDAGPTEGSGPRRRLVAWNRHV